MEDFPANSHASKSKKEPSIEKIEEKRVTKIVEGEVIRRKKPLGKRFAETFFGGDTKGVGSYIVFDVLVPAFKDVVADAVSQGIERMLFGEARSTSRRTGYRSGGSNGYVSYNRYSSNSNPIVRRHEESRSVTRRSRSNSVQEIILATRPEAEEVIDRMFELLQRYETVSVADLYELVGITGEYTDDKWGWTDLRGAQAVRIREGYLIDLPKPDPLNFN